MNCCACPWASSTSTICSPTSSRPWPPPLADPPPTLTEGHHMTSQFSRPSRRPTLAARGLGIAAMLAACSSGGSGSGGGSDGGSGGSDGQDVLARIQESGTVRIGVEGTYRPYAFHDDSGELVGFEKEIADAIAEGLGATAEYIETEWDSLIAGLDVDRYDVVINNVGITEERDQAYAFSEPYAQSIGRIAVPEDSDIETVEDLEGAQAAQTA